MKLHKSTLITVAVTLALAHGAVAADVVGTSTQFSKLTVALTVSTNGVQMERGNSTVNTIGKAKIDNKALLQMLANWSGNSISNWNAAGAQLIYDWDTVQPAVADRTGTNILLYTGSSNPIISGTQTSYFDIDWFNNFGPFTRTFSNMNPGTDTFSDNFDLGYFHLVHNDTADSTAQIDIGANGPKVEKYTQTWDVNHTFLHWTDSEQFKPAGAGEIMNGEQDGAVSGEIDANGSGSGRNTFIYNP